MPDHDPRSERPPTLTGAQIGVLALLVVTLVGSVALRARSPRGLGAPPPGAVGLVEDPGGGEAEPDRVDRALPYLTEASLFGLIGFALGYTTRQLVKLLLVLLALFFLALQALTWTGAVDVDWGGVLARLNALLFNLRANESLTDFLTRRLPAGGSLLLGYAIGFRRG